MHIVVSHDELNDMQDLKSPKAVWYRIQLTKLITESIKVGDIHSVGVHEWSFTDSPEWIEFNPLEKPMRPIPQTLISMCKRISKSVKSKSKAEKSLVFAMTKVDFGIDPDRGGVFIVVYSFQGKLVEGVVRCTGPIGFRVMSSCCSEADDIVITNSKVVQTPNPRLN